MIPEVISTIIVTIITEILIKFNVLNLVIFIIIVYSIKVLDIGYFDLLVLLFNGVMFNSKTNKYNDIFIFIDRFKY